MPSDPRMFTRFEDEMILRQARGEITIAELRGRIGGNITTIARRATELGVKLRRMVSTGRKAGSFPSTHDDLTPARIRNDRLLKRLIEVYGSPPQND